MLSGLANQLAPTIYKCINLAIHEDRYEHLLAFYCLKLRFSQTFESIDGGGLKQSNNDKRVSSSHKLALLILASEQCDQMT